MGLPERGSVSDLVRYRIETAKSDLQSADFSERIRQEDCAGRRNPPCQ